MADEGEVGHTVREVVVVEGFADAASGFAGFDSGAVEFENGVERPGEAAVVRSCARPNSSDGMSSPVVRRGTRPPP